MARDANTSSGWHRLDAFDAPGHQRKASGAPVPLLPLLGLRRCCARLRHAGHLRRRRHCGRLGGSQTTCGDASRRDAAQLAASKIGSRAASMERRRRASGEERAEQRELERAPHPRGRAAAARAAPRPAQQAEPKRPNARRQAARHDRRRRRDRRRRPLGPFELVARAPSPTAAAAALLQKQMRLSLNRRRYARPARAM